MRLSNLEFLSPDTECFIYSPATTNCTQTNGIASGLTRWSFQWDETFRAGGLQYSAWSGIRWSYHITKFWKSPPSWTTRASCDLSDLPAEWQKHHNCLDEMFTLRCCWDIDTVLLSAHKVPNNAIAFNWVEVPPYTASITWQNVCCCWRKCAVNGRAHLTARMSVFTAGITSSMAMSQYGLSSMLSSPTPSTAQTDRQTRKRRFCTKRIPLIVNEQRQYKTCVTHHQQVDVVWGEGRYGSVCGH